MPKTQLIADSFELQRRSKLCNTRGCGKPPAKRVTLYEENRINRERRVLATLYLCSEHYAAKIPGFLTEINKLRGSGRVIDKRVQDMGFITY